MLLVAGKGGVGKTTVACVLARLAARQGMRVLLAQVESRVDAGQLLGAGEVGPEIQEVEPGLSVVNMTPRTALREYGLLIFRFRAVVRAVLENRTMRHFLRAIPGLDDYSMLGKAWYHTTEVERGRSRFDLVVLDAPPTGQLIKILSVPRAIGRSVPDSMLSRDASVIQSFLTDSRRAAALLVTLAEELPVTETLELEAALAELGVHVAGVVANGLYPGGRPPVGLEQVSAAAVEGAGLLAPLMEEARVFQRQREINEQHLGRLARATARPIARLPLLFTEALGSAQISDLAEMLERTGGRGMR